MDDYEILTNAQLLIRDPKNLARDAFARDSAGNEVSPNDDEACSWCTLGAVMKIAGLDVETDAHPTFYLLGRAINDNGYAAIPDYNDQREHSAVMAMFDKAREFARASG